MGWKGEDTGTFANIREEIDEIITCGVSESRILDKLGSQNKTLPRNKISAELKKLGYQRFMFWRGADLFRGLSAAGCQYEIDDLPYAQVAGACGNRKIREN